MLTLPANWRSMDSGFVANGLIAQLPPATRPKSTSHFIEAAFDLFLANRQNGNRISLELLSVAENCWQIGDATYAYFETANDDAFLACLDLAKAHHHLTAIVPHRFDGVWNHAVAKELGPRAPLVLSFPTFVSLRVLFSSGDADCSLWQAFVALLQFYNQRTVAHGADESCLVELPPVESFR